MVLRKSGKWLLHLRWPFHRNCRTYVESSFLNAENEPMILLEYQHINNHDFGDIAEFIYALKFVILK